MRFAVLVFLLFSGPLLAQPLTAKLVLAENIFEKAPFSQCHATSIITLPDNRIMAVWFGGSYERHPDVCIWASVKTRKGWSVPLQLADGIINDSIRYPCWNPVLFRNRKGILHLFYKVGPSPETWWGMVKTSTDNGATWSAPTRLPDGILGPIRNKPLQLAGGRIISPSSTESPQGWFAHMEISEDEGAHWKKIPLDSTTGYKLIQPALVQLKDKSILALLRSNQNYIAESRSADGGLHWSRPVLSSVRNPNSGIDAIRLRNGLLVLVYNPASAGKEWVEGRTKLYVAVSRDGKNWQDVYRLEDGDSGEFSYPALVQSGDGKVNITYTYNRKTIRYVVLELKPDRKP